MLTRSIVQASVKNDYRIVNIERHYSLVLFTTMYWILLIILLGKWHIIEDRAMLIDRAQKNELELTLEYFVDTVIARDYRKEE